MHHAIGNHCLRVGRARLLSRLQIPEPGYYSADLAPGWALVVLDTTEMSEHSRLAEVCARAEKCIWEGVRACGKLLELGHHFETKARRILRARNRNASGLLCPSSALRHIRYGDVASGRTGMSHCDL